MTLRSEFSQPESWRREGKEKCGKGNQLQKWSKDGGGVQERELNLRDLFMRTPHPFFFQNLKETANRWGRASVVVSSHIEPM